jgi:hypothetical protein
MTEGKYSVGPSIQIKRETNHETISFINAS